MGALRIVLPDWLVHDGAEPGGGGGGEVVH